MLTFLLPTLANSIDDLTRLFNSLEKQTNQDFELIIVSQGNHDQLAELLSNYSFTFNHIKIDKKGLSLARNVGLPHVNGDILTFADDDCWYKEDTVDYIHEVFSDSSRQIVCFQHFDPDKNEYAKNYPNEEQRNLSNRRVLQQSSIDIFVHTGRVPDYKIGFDESFGLGTKYKSGEENIYLMDLKNKGYQIDYIPKIVSYHPNKEKLKNLDFDMVVGKGPLFKRLFGGPTGFAMFVAFYFKKFNMISKKNALFKGVSEQFKYKIHKK